MFISFYDALSHENSSCHVQDFIVWLFIPGYSAQIYSTKYDHESVEKLIFKKKNKQHKRKTVKSYTREPHRNNVLKNP